MDLGERIDAWCDAKGKTYQQLADAAGVSVAAVYQWIGTEKRKTKRGAKKPAKPAQKTKPELAHLEAVVAELGLTMEQFYGDVPKTRRAS